MGNLNRWHQVGQGDFQKWAEKGQALEGFWRGTTPGKYGDLGIIETDKGRISFPMHTVLVDRLARVKLGAEVRVEYLGKAMSKGGREFKDFFVGVGSADDLVPHTAEPPDGTTDQDVPF